MKYGLVIVAMLFIIIGSCKKGEDSTSSTTPLVTTAAVTNITVSSATANGAIESNGGAAVTKAGFVWSKINNKPTLEDSLISVGATSGSFTATIVDFNLSTTYYIRAFATNSAGTGYGSIVTFNVNAETVSFTYNGEQVTYGVIVSPTTGKKWLDKNGGSLVISSGNIVNVEVGSQSKDMGASVRCIKDN